MLRLCSPGRLALALAAEAAAAAAGSKAYLAASKIYAHMLGLPAPLYVGSAASALAVALIGAAAGIALRSPSAAAALALAGAQWVPNGLPYWPIPAAPASALLAAALPLAAGLLLSGAASDAGLRGPPRRSGASQAAALLAIAATSTGLAPALGVAGCSWLWAAGALATASLGVWPLGGLPARALVAAASAGSGWHGAFLALALAATAPVEPPRCGGVEWRVEAVYGWHPSHLIMGKPKPRWWGWGFACSRGRGTVVPAGGRGAVVTLWGPRARDAALLLLEALEGLVLCAGCDEGFWASRLAVGVLRYKPGSGAVEARPGLLVTVDSPTPAEHLLTLAGSLRVEGGRAPLVVVDSPGAWGRLLEAAVDELLDGAAGLVAVVYDSPSPPPRLRVPGAHTALAASGPLPPRLLELYLPVAGAAEGASSLLLEGYTVFYPTCGGAAVAVALGGSGRKGFEPPYSRPPSRRE